MRTSIQWNMTDWAVQSNGHYQDARDNLDGSQKHYAEWEKPDSKSYTFGEAKELTCTTHGHELSAGVLLEGSGVPGWLGLRGKNWNNCDSIINKIYLKNKDDIKSKKIKIKSQFLILISIKTNELTHGMEYRVQK